MEGFTGNNEKIDALLHASKRILNEREQKLLEEEILDRVLPLPYSSADGMAEDMTMQLLEKLILPYL